jgi:prophage regulatory protein
MATILRLPTVKARTGLSRSSIYAFVARGDFPRPISLGARAVGWNSESIDAWIAARIDQSRAIAEDSGASKPPNTSRSSLQNRKPRAMSLGLSVLRSS